MLTSDGAAFGVALAVDFCRMVGMIASDVGNDVGKGSEVCLSSDDSAEPMTDVTSPTAEVTPPRPEVISPKAEVTSPKAVDTIDFTLVLFSCCAIDCILAKDRSRVYVVGTAF